MERKREKVGRRGRIERSLKGSSIAMAAALLRKSKRLP